ILAKNFPTTVIMIDLASVASADAANQGISRLIYHKVMQWAGYSKDEKIALLELMMERDELTSRFHELLKEEGFEWHELQNDLLAANAIVSRIACKLYPKLWKDEASFSRIKVDSTYQEDERLKEMLAKGVDCGHGTTNPSAGWAALQAQGPVPRTPSHRYRIH
ncbi:MAG: hypothetical protein EBR81_17570, partial [Proteobacteria bacterium]|nr:hypothetical protein [Pseudomonadota bacterium]